MTDDQLFDIAVKAWESQTSHEWYTDALEAVISAVRAALAAQPPPAPVEGEGWLHLKAKRVLSVDRGQTTVLCDRDIPTELLVLVDASDAREDALEVQGTIEQLEKQLAFERKKSEPSFLHAGSPLWRIDLLCEQHELYTKDELVGLIQKMVQEAGRPNV